ncbi:MAG: hypothetical protein HFE79_09865 [Ruminiclostridium sp.]|nr:hypothetical protein [Ruminiclostridium sp.]
MITVNLIIEAIAAALNGEFGEEYAVYAEEVKQGLSEPCFFISCINPSDRQLMGNANRHFLAARYYRENRFCIQYFSLDENNGRRESYDKAERLFGCLEEISADGDIIRGTDMNFEYTDGILSFFVSYNFFVYRTREPTVMEKFERDVLNK